jgi:hypothetical protein
MCWAGYLNMALGASSELKQLVGMAEDHSPIGTLMLGHPMYDYARTPKRKKAKVSWL